MRGRGPGAMPHLTFVSNGHGEDVIGAALARSLARLAPRLELAAFPLVDEGTPYRTAPVTMVGPRRSMPSGGFTAHSWDLLWADLRAGFVRMTLQQVVGLARLRTDALVVVGDVYAQGLAAFARAPFRAVVQPLVSVRHHQGDGIRQLNRYFMERISYPERVLMRHFADVVYTRDDATAGWLRGLGIGAAGSLGNPMVDVAVGSPLEGDTPGVPVALLPGTRAHTPASLATMATVVGRLPGVTGLVAWSGGVLPALDGWLDEPGLPPVRGRVRALRRAAGAGTARLWVLEGRFSDVLASAELAIATAGTATEQAAALGLPIVTFPVAPSCARSYLENQRRLLGDALLLVEPRVERIADAVRGLLADDAARGRAARVGRERMGAPGGSDRIARDLLERLAAKVPASVMPDGGAA